MFTEDFYKNVVIKELQKIDSTKIRVSEGSPKIFLCGGELETDEKKKPKSARDYLLREINESKEHAWKDRLIIAESIFTKYREKTLFSSLLDLENSISAFCTSVVILLESPGSIAELGSFCVDESIRKKLFVFIRQEHNESNSYIKHGPLAEINNERIFSYAWPLDQHSEDFHKTLVDITPYLIEDLTPLMEQEAKSSLFDESNIYHLAALMASFCQIMFPLQVSEAKNIFELLGFKVSKNDLMKAARVGVLFGDFKKMDKGNEFFYPSFDSKVVDFSSKSRRAIFDVVRFNMQCSKYLDENRDKERRRVSALNDLKNMGLYK